MKLIVIQTRRIFAVATFSVFLFMVLSTQSALGQEFGQDNLAAEFIVSEQAMQLAQNSIIIDGHIDVPHRLYKQWVDVTQSTDGGDFDYPRAKAGGLNAPFMSIYVPASLDGTEGSTARAHLLIDSVEKMVSQAPEKFSIASSTAEVEAHFEQGIISLPLGMENGAPINGDMDNLKVFYDRGIRYITLTHSRSNNISDSSYDITRQWNGLSPFGKDLVKEMNDLGVMVDISHVSDDAFYDTLAITSAPVIASHSSLRFFTPGFERNMNDEMMIALAENGGIIMINFGSTFIDAQARKWADQRSIANDKVIEEFGADSEQAVNFSTDYLAANPLPFSDLERALDHFDYAVDLIGIDHVGIGSDYDGVGDSLPINLKDVASYPNLVQGLLDRGYSEIDIEKILGENLLRVWREVEMVANH